MTWGTMLSNPYSWMAMGPYAWTSTYGGEYQFNVLPDSWSAPMAQLFHGGLSPNHVSQWNPLFSIPIQNSTTDPRLVAQGQKTADDYVKNVFYSYIDGTSFSRNTQLLASITAKVDSLMQNEDVPQEYKDKLTALKEEVKKLEEQYSELKKEMNLPDADKDELRTELAELSESSEELKKEFIDLLKEIKEALSAEDDGKVDDEEKVDDPKDDNDVVDDNKDKPDSKVEGEAGPNGTVVKDGKYYAADGTLLYTQYAKGTEMKLDGGLSARVWENGEKVTYRDKDGKVIKPAEFMNQNQNAYLEILNQQFVNALGEKAKDIKAEVIEENGKIAKIEFEYNGKKVLGNAPVDVKAVLQKLGAK